jgi:hypothetical protein
MYVRENNLYIFSKTMLILNIKGYSQDISQQI